MYSIFPSLGFHPLLLGAESVFALALVFVVLSSVPPFDLDLVGVLRSHRFVVSGHADVCCVWLNGGCSVVLMSSSSFWLMNSQFFVGLSE
ncbi:hypothetical protein YC2023_106558 [Brassica napus]